ncbi:hypothetical protein FJU08_16110 [Martelella alba]|uniref:Uncharacterized protein n=1 Tax=Martelella alba TaxID=2590451 RepID=A0A506U391_9HYPH|nr:hypothetical protein [Martelella alba]TPW28852.1 hypothetical protein FJU08_16110 [Martelella alba]
MDPISDVSMQGNALERQLSQLQTVQANRQAQELTASSLKNAKLSYNQMIQNMNFEAARSMANVESQRLLGNLSNVMKLLSSIVRTIN